VEPRPEASDAEERGARQPLVGASAPRRPLQAGAARRDFAALLEVTRDDALRLVAGVPDAARRRGLHAKVGSALGVLPLAARAYLQSDARAEATALAELARAARAARASDWPRTAVALSVLCAAYPVSLAGLRPEDAAPNAVLAAGGSYRARCAMCHRVPAAHAELPAPDLARWARRMPAREFVARMIDGVHGTAFTGFENPMSDAEIAAFYAYLQGVEGARASSSHGHGAVLLRHSPRAAP